jgi:3-hydroxybutyryl-CoA dehydratase
MEDLVVGKTHTREYVISEEVHAGFLAAFADHSPIHVKEEVAKQRGFSGRVMHGTILNGFLSHFVGMEMPGAQSLLLSSDVRYAAPCYMGDRVLLHGTIEQRVEAMDVVVMKLVFENITQNVTAARGRVQVKVSR